MSRMQFSCHFGKRFVRQLAETYSHRVVQAFYLVSQDAGLKSSVVGEDNYPDWGVGTKSRRGW